MATEIELKCMMSQANLAEAEKWMLGVGAMRAHSVKLVNRYYDTPDRQLNKHKIALRIREKEGKFFQTLKTKGSSVEGCTSATNGSGRWRGMHWICHCWQAQPGRKFSSANRLLPSLKPTSCASR